MEHVMNRPTSNLPSVAKHIVVASCELKKDEDIEAELDARTVIRVKDSGRARAAHIPTGKGVITCAPNAAEPGEGRVLGTIVTGGYDRPGVSAKSCAQSDAIWRHNTIGS
jgi:hypothetical protein